jgi:hypothetical protein
MSWRAKRAAAEPVRMVLRYAQALQDGQVRLDSFTQPELDCVTLDPDALAPDIRGPALLAAAPLLAGLATRRLGGGDRPGDDPELAALAWAAADQGRTSDDAELATAAAGLEARGLIRPGTVAPCDVNVPEEFAGWSADPAGGTAPRPVGITGDLGVITRMRSQPYWVAEASACTTPTAWDPVAAPWQVTGRMYAAYRPPAALVEIPLPGGAAPQFSLLWQHQSVRALVVWCGIDLDELADRRHAAQVDPVPPAPTAAVAPEFTSVSRLRIAHPDGQRALVRTLLAATGRDRRHCRHWLLTGERAEIATRASVDQIGEQLDVLLQPVAQPES